MKQTFYVISDPQIGNYTQEQSMERKRDTVLANCSKNDVVIIPGDLTESGKGSIKNPIIKYCCVCHCIRGDTVKDWRNELQDLKDKHINPLKEGCGDVLMCIGNHDSQTQYWTGYNPVFGYVKKEHGSQRYKKDVNGIMVYSLSEWPRKKDVDWLVQNLKKDKKVSVLFFHYNLKGPYSNWWSEAEKQYLAERIQPFKKMIAFIAEGHVHTSYISKWNDIVRVNGAGFTAIQVDVVTNDEGELESVISNMI